MKTNDVNRIISTLEEEILNKAGNQMARDIDREVLWGMLEGIGWSRVMLPTMGNGEQAVEIMCWLEDNCKGSHERWGRDFIFENQKDANWFKLRWGTV
jgi:hypothetical protein